MYAHIDPEDVEHLRDESRLYRVRRHLDRLLPAVIAALVVVLAAEFLLTLSPWQHAAVIWLQRLILLYFVAEIGIDLWLYTHYRTFLRHKWLDIVLIIPFLTLFREVVRGLQALKILKPAKAAKPATAAKPAKGAKAVKTSKLLKAKKHLKRTKYAQKAGKAVKKGRHLLDAAEDEAGA